MSLRYLASLAALVAAFGLAPAPVAGQIHDVRDLNVDQIRSLDRQKTVVMLQGGIIEEHGPFLPVYSDGFLSEYLAAELARAIVARPGWQVVLFPVIPLGSGGANEIGRKYSFPGTFAVRPETLRAVYMDLATALGEQGFRWIFLMNHHGAPSHSRALLDACDYYRDTFGGTMVHFWGLAPIMDWEPEALGLWDQGARQENSFLTHADMLETSWNLFLRPTAVSDTYKTAPSSTGRDLDEMVRIAVQPAWSGYFGSPKHATASQGAQAVQQVSTRIKELALRILDGLDERTIERFPDRMTKEPAQVKIDADAAAHDAELERTQAEWLERRNRTR